MEPAAAARAVLRTDHEWMALGNEVFQAAGATFIRNRSLPRIHDANFAWDVTASTPAEIDLLLETMGRELGHSGSRRFRLDATSPGSVEARLALDGYEHRDGLLMLLEGEPAGRAPAHEIRAVVTDADWDAYAALQAVDWQEYLAKSGRHAPDDLAPELFRHHRIKCPPVRSWLAVVDGTPAAYLSSWEGVDAVGQVEELFTHPDQRHTGLATALLRHGIADCRAHGARTVLIACNPDDTPKNMYAAMGFQPVAITREWWKSIAPTGSD